MDYGIYGWKKPGLNLMIGAELGYSFGKIKSNLYDPPCQIPGRPGIPADQIVPRSLDFVVGFAKNPNAILTKQF